MERLTIVDEYLNYQRQYEEKYGEATIVLMEVGSFFEIYGVETEAEFVGRVSEISSLLGIQKTKKDKKVAIESRRVPLMAGFPNYRINKFLKKLLEHHYTVVLVEQITPAPNPERGVTAVHSPGTYTEEVSNDIVVNMLTCIYIETNLIRGTGRYTLSIGISMIDLTNGII